MPGNRTSLLKLVGAVLSSNLFLLASCTGIGLASNSAMKLAGGRYTARGEAPYPSMFVIASIPDPAAPGLRKLEPVTLRGLAEFQDTHPDYTFVIPAGNARIGCISYRATALGDGAVRVETEARCDDLFARDLIGSYEATQQEVRPIYSNLTFGIIAGFFGVAGACLLRIIGAILVWLQRRRLPSGWRGPPSSPAPHH